MDTRCRYMLLISSGLFFAIAMIIITTNIPEEGLMAGGHIVVGLILLAIALGARSPSTRRRVLAYFVGLITLSWVPEVLYTGIFRWHDPALRGALLPLAVAAGGDLAIAALVLTAAGLIHHMRLALRQVWRQLWNHPGATILVMACWLILLTVAAVTWFRAPSAWNQVFTLCVIFALPVGMLTVWWQSVPTEQPNARHLADRLLAGILVALIVMEVNQVLFVAWDIASYMIAPAPSQPDEQREWRTYLGAAIGWLWDYGGLAIGLGLVGGLVAAGMAVVWQRWQRRIQPAAPVSML